MKQKYKMLSMMILGPRQPRNDIDVYLSPFIEDLTKLWDERDVVFDGSRCGMKGMLCLMGLEMRHSSYVQCYFVPLMTFQHTGI